MDDKVTMVLDTMRLTTSDNDGVIIEPLDLDDGVLRVRYYGGTNEECPECVMGPDAFAEMVKAMCAVQAPYVSEVEVVPVG